MEKEALLEECKVGWLSVEKDFKARLGKPELLKYALQLMGRNPSDKAIEHYWSQAGGSVSFEQFILVMRRERKTSMSDLKRAFRKIDTNGDGFITTKELQRKLTKRGEKMSVDEVEAIIAEADLNGDGKLDYAEFCHMLLNASEECIHANRQKTLHNPKLKQDREKQLPNAQRMQSSDRRERRREEIRMHLYSPEIKSPSGGLRERESNYLEKVPVDSTVQPTLSSFSQENSTDVNNAEDDSETHNSHLVQPKNTEVPPLKKVPLPPLQLHQSKKGDLKNVDNTSNIKGEEVARDEGSVADFEPSTASQTEDKDEARQTGHLIPDVLGAEVQEGVSPKIDDEGVKMQGDSSGSAGREEAIEVQGVDPPLSDGAEVQEKNKLSGTVADTLKCSIANEEAKISETDKNGSDVKHTVSETAISVITPPPRKSKNIETWNSITGKGCFYLEASEEPNEEHVIKCHHYHLKLPSPTNVWVEVGVATPGAQETNVLLFVFRMDDDEKVTEVITYTQHKVDEHWICRMDLDPGTYALIPFTCGCFLKPPEEDGPTGGTSAVPLTASSEGGVVLTPECIQALEEAFHRVDLDNNGYISRTEFDFFQEVTSGELCDDDAWKIILSNFDVTSEEEITLKGFLQLHEMSAADEEGGEEEVWQVLKALGYNKYLQLHQACPFQFEVLTEDCEGEIEIVDLLPFSPVIDPALSQLVIEKGVEGPVNGGEKDELATYTFTTPHLTTIVVENKSSKTAYVQLDCSLSVNCLSSKESTVHVVEVEANSSAIGYHLQPANSHEPYTVCCTASKILS